MMSAILSVIVLCAASGQAVAPSVQALTGTWVSTVTPPPPSAPIIPATLQIDAAAGAVSVIHGERRTAVQVFVAGGPGMSAVGPTLRFKAGDQANAPGVTIRPAGPDRIEVEYLFEPAGSSSTGRKYVETFTRKK
jgi:hypothetical protein